MAIFKNDSVLDSLNGGNSQKVFSKELYTFDDNYSHLNTIRTIVPVHTNPENEEINIRRSNGHLNEQYYKWKLIYSLVNSGLCPKEYIGTEIHFPKGNKSSSDLILDAAIFDDENWFEHYSCFYQSKCKNLSELEWLHSHLMVVIEVKQEDGKNIREVWDKQLKAYMKESSKDLCIGILFDTDRLYLFQKIEGKFVRYNQSLNDKGVNSSSADMNLSIPDSFYNIPSFQDLSSGEIRNKTDITNRGIEELDIINSLHSTAINNAMSIILNSMSSHSLIDQKGYNILIQILAIKVFDEKRNQKYPNVKLDFYITEKEKKFTQLNDDNIQCFITRFENLIKDANEQYRIILSHREYDKYNINHIRVIACIVEQFQNYSFVKSQKTDLYQIIFYQFANKFASANNAQFVTPIPIVQFLVNIINPRSNESVIDPTCGISDFLSVSYVSSGGNLDDGNIYGMDIDKNMITLSTLNMLLNGDGNAHLKLVEDMGSISTKFSEDGDVFQLEYRFNENGNWDVVRPDGLKIKKFNVVLTNPPFGEDRAYKPNNEMQENVMKCYEIWNTYNTGKIDLGVVFLENACRILKENGRMGIILSNSIASIDAHKKARQWLIENMRVVAVFDLPQNVFAETGVNTTIIVAYKPSKRNLERLKQNNYEIFMRDIENVGYEVVTVKRVKKFVDKYKIDEKTFKYMVNEEGMLVKDEDFTRTVADFKDWCKSQETNLRKAFINDQLT